MRPIWIALIGILISTNLAGAAFADGTNSTDLLAQAPADSVLLQADTVVADEAVVEEPVRPESVNLQDLIQTAFENNPSIAAARSNWQAMVEMYPQATAYPDPKLGLNWFPEPIETRNGSNDFAVSIMQMIPSFGRLGVMGDIALSKAEMAEVAYEKTVRDTLTDVLSSYFELGYLHRAQEISATNRDLYQQLVDFGDLRYAQGSIGSSELYAAESQLAQAEYENILLMELLYSERAKMRSLLGVGSDYPIGDVILPEMDPVELDLDDLKAKVLDYRHELEMAGISVEIAEHNVDLAKSLDDPSYSLGLMYNFIGTSPMSDDMRTSGDDAWGIMFGITIPIWSGKNNARIDQARAQLDSAIANYENQSNQAETDIEKLYWKLQNQARLVELYRDTLLPDSVQAADLAQTWYEQDQISFTGLMESRMVVQNFELATARAQADYLISLTDLQKLTGIPVFSTEDEEAES